MTMPDEPTPTFGSLLNNTTFGGPRNIIVTLFRLNCFNHPQNCSKCGARVRLEISSAKKLVCGRETLYTSGRIRCCSKDCHVSFSLVENTIWSDIGDRTLFVFVVGGFITRMTTASIAAMSGSREDTISKYYRIIKNAIHIKIEEELQSFVLGGEGERVQIDESHVFT